MKTRELSAYLRPPTRAGLWMLVVAVLLCAVAAVAFWQVFALDRDDVEVRRQVATLRLATQVKPAPTLSKVEIDQNKRWTELQTERGFAWAPLFNALEAAGNADIELLELHPDKPSASVILRGEAKDEAALLEFMERLARSPALQQVYLSHRKSRKRDRLVTIAFELKAKLAPALRPQ
ncbi:hypothetical protein GTP58_06455 [Duganella sp. CY15W]|uniref:PilN domain-containing protein n=1 Tax=Duganella sp. CY15W TaxID=2692172 RepID=UPI00136B17A0|nr:PilN domain-containing protein [Duganella sp. CY15W]MYM27959.1 hypothetical protein [Duganella sp. CY15W]